MVGVVSVEVVEVVGSGAGCWVVSVSVPAGVVTSFSLFGTTSSGSTGVVATVV